MRAGNKKIDKPKVELKWRTIKVKVPVCPECGSNMEKKSDINTLATWIYRCTKCNYKHLQR